MQDGNYKKAANLAASRLPDDYTVLYSYKYIDNQSEFDKQIREADFIFVHPALGYLVVEVKQGDIQYNNGVWYEFKNLDYIPMAKNPLEQAQKAMYAILEQFKIKSKMGHFPLKIRCAVAFPECSRFVGELPADLNQNSIFLCEDLENLLEKIEAVFDMKERKKYDEATDILLNKVLAPSFKVFAKLEDKIEAFHRESEFVLSEEQNRILEETELDNRKIFLGSAGTGKTLIAKEKALRLANQGKKVLLTCYNEELAQYELSKLEPKVMVASFHLYLEQVLKENGQTVNRPEKDDFEKNSEYFEKELPNRAFDYISSYENENKFDAIIVDEGQDFRQDWITCLEGVLKEDGVFYIFADIHQNLFKTDINSFKNYKISKHKLLVNFRNTAFINEWINKLMPTLSLKSSHLFSKLGIPVKLFECIDYKEEKKLISDEIGRLVSQGIQPKRITILSPRKKERSSLSGMDKIKSWDLAEERNHSGNCIRFDTIRAFKGFEADIVFLIGIKHDSKACSLADIYVGGSRARFLLYIFHESGWGTEYVSGGLE